MTELNKKWINHARGLLLALVSISLYASNANAFVSKIAYQGNIRQSGTPLTGSHNLVFRIYTVPTGGVAVYTSPTTPITFNNGKFFTLISPTGVDWEGASAYLEIEVDGTVLVPREELVASAYSFNSLLLSGKRYTSAASAPSAPNSGDLWYDTSVNQLKYFDATTWVVPSGASTVTINTFEFSGDGAGTALKLQSSSVTLQGNTFNIANKLVQLDGTGKLPAVDGSQLTGLPSGAVTSNAFQFSGDGSATPLALVASSVTLQGNAFNGSNQLVKTDGIGRLPAIDGSQLTNLPSGGMSAVSSNASEFSGDGNGTPLKLLSSSVTLQGNTFNAANKLLKLDGSALVPNAQVDASSITKQGNTFNAANQLVKLDGTGKLPAVDGSLLTNLPGGSGNAVLIDTQTFSGQNTFLNEVKVSTNLLIDNGGSLSLEGQGSAPPAFPGRIYFDSTGDGALKISLNGASYVPLSTGAAGAGISAVAATAAEISGDGNGTPLKLQSSSVTLQGNDFNAANKLVKLDGTSRLPAVDGSQLTNIGNAATATSLAANGSNATSGRLCLGVDASGNCETAAVDTVEASGSTNPITSGALFAHDAAASAHHTKTTDASELATGTLPNARIDASSVTKQGNLFNAANQLVKLDGTGKLPAIDGSLLTNVSGSGGISSVTSNTSEFMGDGTNPSSPLKLLSSSVTLQGNDFNAANKLLQLDGNALVPNAQIDASSLTKQGNLFNAANQLVKLDGTGKLPAIDGSLLTNLPGGGGSAVLVDTQTFSGQNTFLNEVKVSTNLLINNGGSLSLEGQGSAPPAFPGRIYFDSTGDGALKISLNGASYVPLSTGSAAGGISSVAVDAAEFSGDGAGTPLKLRSSSVTLQGNDFNAANKLVKLDGTSRLPAVDGSQLTNIGNAATATSLAANGSNATSGRLCLGVDASGNCETAAVDTVEASGSTNPITSGALFAHDASASAHHTKTTDASELTSGLLPNARIDSASITMVGNDFNVANKLVQLDGTGKLPAIDGSQLTNLPGGGGSAVLVATQTFSGQNTFNNQVNVSSNLYINNGGFLSLEGQGSAPTAFPGRIYFDSTGQGALKISLDGSSFVPISTGGAGGGIASVSANASEFSGDGAGTPLKLLSSSVTLQGNNVNAANGLVKLDGAGKLPAIDGSQLTNLPGGGGGADLAASNTFTGQNTFIQDVKHSTGLAATSGSQGVDSSKAAFWGQGWDGFVSAQRPFYVYNQVTNSTAWKLLFNTGNADLFSINQSGDVQIASVNATTISAGGHITMANLSAAPSAQKGRLWFDDSGDGALKVSLDGSTFVSLSTGGVGGTVAVTSAELSGDGSATPLKLQSSSVTLQGNDFNAANKLVKLDGINRLPAVDGSLLTNLPGGGGDPVTGANTVTLGADSDDNDASSAILFTVDNVEQARIDSNGRLGLGTNSPSSKLHITDGRITVDGASPGLTVGVSSFVVTNEKVGIGVVSPNERLDIDGAMVFRGMSAPSPASGGQGKMYFDSTANKIKFSESGGAFVNLIGGAGGALTLQAGTPGLTDTGHVNLSGTALIGTSIGISTGAPQDKLHLVDGNIRISTTGGSYGIIFQDGSVQTTAGPTAFWTPNASDIYSAVAGNVGIGITNPSGKFHVDGAGDVKFTNSGNVEVGAVASAEKLSVVGIIESESGGFKFPDGSVQTIAAGSSLWQANGSMISNSNAGHVGISTGTPQARLDVQGEGGVILDAGNVRIGSDARSARLMISTPSSSASDIMLQVTSNTVGGSDILTLRADGKFGIGTGAPVYPMHIVSNEPVRATIFLDNNSDVVNQSAAIRFAKNGSDRWGIFSDFSQNGTNDLTFFDAAGGAHRFYIADDGKVAIGGNNITPAAQLDVQGSGGVILNAGNVGVGTNSPASAFNVVGKSSMSVNSDTEPALQVTMTGAAPAAVFQSTDVAVDVEGAMTLKGMAAPAISVSGETKLYFDSSTNKLRISENNGVYTDLIGGAGGAVGLQGATPGTGEGGHLHITGTGLFDTAVGVGVTAPSGSLHVSKAVDPNIVFENTGDNTAIRNTSVNLAHSAGVGAQILGTRQSGNADGMDMAFATEEVGGALTTRMTIKDNGLIGMNVTNPTELLDIDGAMVFRGTDTPVASAAGQGKMFFDSATNKIKFSENGGGFVNLVGGAGGAITLQPTTPGSADTGHLNITGSALVGGNLGMGITSPTQKIDIRAGGIAITTDSIAGSAFFIHPGTAKTGFGTPTPQNKLDTAGAAVFGLAYAGVETAPADGMLVEGTVGVGTTSPQTKMEIEGSFSAGNGATKSTITAAGAFDLYGDFTGGGHVLPRLDGAKDLGSLTKRWSNLWVSQANITSLLDMNGALMWKAGNIIPQTTDLSDLGSQTLQWQNVFTSTVVAQQIAVASKVGIGTDAPATALHIEGTDRVILNAGNVSIGATDTEKARLYVSTPSALAAEDVFLVSTAADLFTVKGDGKVGVAEMTPGSTLTVKGLIESTGGGYKFPDGSVQMVAAGASQWAANGSHIYNTNVGNVGFGTTTPDALLHVAGAGNGRNIILNAGNIGIGTSSMTARVLISTPSAAASEFMLLISTSDSQVNSEVFSVKGDGKVGINTANPLFTMHVKHPLASRAIFLLDNTNNTAGTSSMIKFAKNSSDKWNIYSDIADDGTNNFSIFDAAAAKHRIFISATGNVGIGHNTSPEAELNVLGTSSMSIVSNVLPALQVTMTGEAPAAVFQSTDVAVDIEGALTFKEMGAPGVPVVGEAKLYFDQASNKLRISEDGGAYTDLLGGAGGAVTLQGPTPGVSEGGHIHVSGTGLFDTAVGIGTTTPQGALHVDGTGSTTALYIDRAESITAGDASGLVGFRAEVAGGVNKPMAQIMGFVEGATIGSEGMALRFDTMNGGTMAERMRISSTGYVGMGVSVPTERLDMDGALVLREMVEPTLSEPDTVKLYFDTFVNKLKISEHGSAFSNLSGAAVGAVTLQPTSPGVSDSGNLHVNGIGIFGNKVGIGTTLPLQELDVRSGGIAVSSSATSGMGLFLDPATANVGIGTASPGQRLDMRWGGMAVSSSSVAGMSLFIDPTNGRVGMGSVTPSNTLTVAGTADVTTSLAVGTASASNALTVSGDADISGKLGIGTAAPSSQLDVTSAGGSKLEVDTTNATFVLLKSNGVDVVKIWP